MSSALPCSVAYARHDLPQRRTALPLSITGAGLLVCGLALAAYIASDLAAANVRDFAINTWFWNLGQAHPWLLVGAQRASWLVDGPRNIVIVAAVSILLLVLRQWRWAIFLVVESQVGVLVSNLLKFSIARERPPFIENTDLQQHLSFPSGHTFAGFTVWCALALIAWYLLPVRASVPVAAALVAVGIVQAPARLIVGKHWLTDVLGSWLIGSGWLLLVWAAFVWWLAPRAWQDSKSIPPAPPAG